MIAHTYDNIEFKILNKLKSAVLIKLNGEFERRSKGEAPND